MTDQKRVLQLAKRCSACGNPLDNNRAILENGDILCPDCFKLAQEEGAEIKTYHAEAKGVKEITLYFKKEHFHILDKIGEAASRDFRTKSAQIMYILSRYEIGG